MPVKKQADDHSLASQYERLLAQGKLTDDAAQRDVLSHLQTLLDKLAKPRRLFAKSAPASQGLYIWGNVGRGKSMLMDLFFAQAPVVKKRRVHFHAFMQEVHARLHALRQTGAGDPVMLLAGELAAAAPLLCFDELQATDVTDATLLYRLFDRLFELNVTIVSTSNRPPETLYTGNIQRERFDKFIALLNAKMEVLSLDSPADYRRRRPTAASQTYFTPLGKEADRFIKTILSQLPPPHEETLTVQGRTLLFTACGPDTGRFPFHDLCDTALGPADYLALVQRIKTLILTDIPLLSSENRDQAKRFTLLIDALYEQKTTLICTAAAAPDRLCPEGDASFAFQRTASRLMEMQSESYKQTK